MTKSTNHHNSKRRLPRLSRVADANRVPFRMTARDEEILRAVYRFRVLTSVQIERLLFLTPGKPKPSNTRCNLRLQGLFHHGFLARSEQVQKITDGRKPLLYFLDRRGAEYLAAQDETEVTALDWRPSHNRISPLFLDHLLQTNDVRIDIELACKLHSGYSTRAYGPLAVGSPFEDKSPQKFDLDLAKANKMLDEAGHKRGADGTRFKIRLDTLLSQRDVAEYLKPQLKKVGIDVELRIPPDLPTWMRWVGGHEFDMTMDVVFTWGDPVIGVHRTYLTSNIRKGLIWSNTQSYSNAEADKLMAAGSKEMDAAKRKAIYLQFQKRITDDMPVHFMYSPPYHLIYNKKVQNPPLTVWGIIAPLHEVWLKD